MKLDELVEDVMNLDINKESMDDNRSHSQDQSTVCSNSFNIDILAFGKFQGYYIFVELCYFIFVKLRYFEFWVEVYAIFLECKELISR